MRYALQCIGIALLSISTMQAFSQEELMQMNKKKYEDETEGMDTPSESQRYSWPIVSVGAGATFYMGGVKSPRDLSKFNGIRWGVNAQVEQRFGKFLGAKLNLFYGLTAGEKHTFLQFDNFQSRLIGTDIRFCVHLDHLFKRKLVAPYFSVGVGYVNYRTKSDLQDADGKQYHLWNDGSLRDQEQNSQTNGNPTVLRRDYTYETVSNKSGNTLTVPVEAGLRFKMHDYWDLGFGYTHTLILNKFLVTPNNKRLDNYGYASATVYWYLGQFN